MIFDSQGFDNPILEEKIEKDENDINNENYEKKENEVNNMNKNINQGETETNANYKTISENINNNYNNIFNQNIYEDLEEFKKINNYEELKINKKLSEEFITRFIVDYSDMIITVVGILKNSEQIMLKNIMEECLKHKKETLYVIHNLQNLTSKEQVNDYIKNVLMKSTLFDLEEKDEIINDDFFNLEVEKENEDKEDVNPIYYSSKYKSLTINHLIFINDNCDEKYYNKITKQQIKHFVATSDSTKFNISSKIQEKIYDLLKDYSKNQENITIEITKPEGNKGKIIYKGDENLKFKKYFKNVLTHTRSEIQLKYNFYISTKDGKDKLFILIERPGDIIDEHIIPSKNDMIYIIQYRGIKCLSEEENKQKNNMKNVGREFGEFIMDIPIALKDYEISNLEQPNYYEKDGIEYIEYELKNISKLNIEMKKKETNSK